MLIRLSTALFVALLLRAPSGLMAAELRVEARASASGLSALATNELGEPAPGAVVSFQLPAQAPSGVFANGLRTEIVVAGKDGRAAVNGVRWDGGTAPILIRVTASQAGARAATIAEWRAVQPGPIAAVVETAANAAPSIEPAPPKPATDDTVVPVYRGGSGWGKRLLWIAAIAAGAAAGGYAVQTRRAPGAAVSAATVTTAPPGLSIGAPIITVGKP